MRPYEKHIFSTIADVGPIPNQIGVRITLKSGHTLDLPPPYPKHSVPMNPGDKLIIDLAAWTSDKPVADVIVLRANKALGHFVIEDGCEVGFPNDEVVYDGDSIYITADEEDLLTITHKQDEKVSLALYPLEHQSPRSIMLSPNGRSRMEIAVATGDAGVKVLARLD